MSDLRDQQGPGQFQVSPAEIPRVRGVLVPGASVGEWRVERHLASGHYGSMYLAADPAQGRKVAIKVLHPELVSFGEPFIRFLREARILDLVRHPNVVEIYDSGVLSDGRAYLVMEYLEGEDLATHLRDRGRISPARAAAILEPVCDALSHAHARGVIHRGLKASNVFLCSSEPQRIVLLDFVLAKLSERGSIEVTSSRIAIGSPASLAPEQIRGQSVDARSDVYGLGALLYQMLTGRAPFENTSWVAVQRMHLHAPRPRPSRYAPLAPVFDEIVTRAMSAEPADRYPSAQAFLDAVRRAAAEASAGTISSTAIDITRLAEAAEQAPDTTPVLAVYVDARIDTQSSADDAGGADEPDDDQVLEAVDKVLERAASVFAERGFQPALQSSNASLFVCPLGADPDTATRERHQAVMAALDFQRTLAAYVDAGPWLCVNVTLHSGSVRFVDGQPGEGDVLAVETWAPEEPLRGIVGTSRVFDGLGAQIEPVDDTGALWRLQSLATIDEPAPAGVDALADLVAAEPAPDAGSGASNMELNDPRVMHLEMMAQIGRHTAGIVHDLRSPLTVIRGSLELVLDNMRENQPLSATERKVLENAYLCAQQMTDMVGLILKASAIKSYATGTRKVLSVNDLVENALKLMSKELRRKATISVRHDGESWVYGSPLRLTQVLINLIVNASQAILKRGRIDIETATTPEQRVLISVRDTGIGMTPDVQARVFEPYFSTKEAGEGTGLGLSLAYAIIQEHGGEIQLSSTPGEGSCFVIDLPAAPPDTSASGQP
jgi:serine/threonine-protein kinase